ncbi:MAG: phytoene desaturase [Myxococcales bacterium]|nr:phytoene desaturase [Myxococcales bacterium]
MIAGGGVAGLSAAIDLARAGQSVLLLERASTVGGKMRQLFPPTEPGVEPRGVDAGPTVMTMRWVFDELFADAGVDFERRVTLERQDPIARHFFDDGAVLDLHHDVEQTAQAIADFADKREARGYRRFIAHAEKIYREVEAPFLRGQRPSFTQAAKHFGIRGLAALWRIDMRRSMWRALGEFFKDERVRRVFARYATYSGCSPMLAPATYNLVAHVEQQGVYRVRGGMAKLSESLEALARELGVAIETSCTVDEIVIEQGRARALRLASGERLEAEAIVWAGDVAALASGKLGEAARAAVKPVKPTGRSLSAVTWAALATPRGLPLLHHNVLFSGASYPQEFDAIFEHNQVPEAPTVYLCAQDRGGLRAVNGRERMLLLINAPAAGDDAARFDAEEISRCEQRMHETLQRCGLTLEQTSASVTTPRDFERMFPATGGALYGSAAHSFMAVFSKEGSRSAIPALYLAGGSVHPGPGVPMAALSGRRAAESICADLASTATSRRVAISGGTSMR